MKNRKLFDDLLAQYNREQHTTISLIEDELGQFTPTIDLEAQTITFNPHVETLFMLFNLSNNHRLTGSKAIHHFLLFHLAMGKNMYSEAEELLHLFQSDFCQVKPAKEIDKIPLTAICMECQIIFLLMHEASHIYYHHHPEVLSDNRKAMKERLYWLRNQLDTDRSFLVRLMQFLIPGLQGNMEHSFDEAKADSSLQEELLCDEAAWRFTFNLIKQNVSEEKQQAMLAAYVVYTLYYIEAQRTLENIFMTTDTAVRQKDLMFDTSRTTVLVYLIWDFIAPSHLHTFRSLVNAISRQARLFLMLPLRANVNHIAYIRLGNREKYSLKENLRITSAYKKMIHELFDVED